MRLFNKITEKEIRQRIFESEEGLSIRLEMPGTMGVEFAFTTILNRSATQEELDYYSPLLYNKTLTTIELQEILKSTTDNDN